MLGYLNEQVVQPTIAQLLETCRPLGLDRSLREDFVQLPEKAEIKEQLTRRILGEWSDNGSIRNQISVMIDRTNIEENGETSYRIGD